METNLAKEKPVYYEVGTKVLTETQLSSLVDGVVASGGVSISSGETLSIVCDLGARYSLSQIYYYRTRATSDTITIYGRQNIGDSWTELTSPSTSSTYHQYSISGLNKYRHIRVVHSVSSGSATARELEVYTDDDDIKFGSQEQGLVDSYSIDSGTEELVPLAVYVRNPDSTTHDFFVLLDPFDAESTGYKLSYSEDGPYYSLYETGVNLPRDFAWSSGHFINTSVFSGDVVKLTAGVSGTYYTPVLDINAIDGRRFFWRQTISGSNQIDIDSQVDSISTVQVRMSNTVPSSPWVNGQLSTDSRWSVVSGSLPFSILPNGAIFDPAYRRYFQARVELHATVSGQSPVLVGVGVESGFKITVSGGKAEPVYVKSSDSNISSNDTTLVCWTFEDRTIE